MLAARIVLRRTSNGTSFVASHVRTGYRHHPARREQRMASLAMTADWFEELTGFRERSYDETQKNLEVSNDTLRSRVNGKSYVIGELETPTLRELRSRALVAAPPAGTFTVSGVIADVASLHRDPVNRN